MGEGQDGFEQVVQNLPIHLRQKLLTLPQQEREQAEEIRLRVGQPMRVYLAQEERVLSDAIVWERDLEHALELASQASLHLVLPKLRQGYLPLRGGHRMGLCGSVLWQKGEIQFIRPVFSMNLRKQDG